MGTSTTADNEIDDFIGRWSASEGAERANFQSFANELCDLIGVGRPKPSVSVAEANHYAFERGVQFKDATGAVSQGWIDLYKRNAFVMEAKQSREKGGKKELRLADTPALFAPDLRPQGKRGANRAWDVLMLNARRQAEDYAKALPTADGWPPFILVCDVGHCIEIYSDFSGQGKNYAQFPDRQSFRIYMEDLRDAKVRERLRRIWDEPHALNPALQSSKVTREISARLAAVSKRLEASDHDAEEVALFLMRCLFTMFAEDVKLLPADCFRNWLERARTNQAMFKHELSQLWQAMDAGGYATIAQTNVKRFNGSFFKTASVIELQREDIGELWEAAKADWREVDPAIFGTLLEQALNEKERGKLGAHYTPRAYVERLVVVTIIEPLRQEWAQVQATAERFTIEADALDQEAREAGRKGNRRQSTDKASEARGKREDAMKLVRGFHARLCTARVLDPACGTGNFLYVALELMKKLEGDVLEAMLELGDNEGFTYLQSQTVDPHQFLGIEINPRAAAIAEMVIWLGFLQRHLATKGDAPPEPILHDFKNIRNVDAVLTWDGYPRSAVVAGTHGSRTETFPNARRPEWPASEFIVGNPPFIGKGEPMREAFTSEYLDALAEAHLAVGGSADFVMYWWDMAAELLSKGAVARFGFVTTNSIDQYFNRRVVANWLQPKKSDLVSIQCRVPISLVMAVPDHPWRKRRSKVPGEPVNSELEKHAAVRIAMTVGASGEQPGTLWVLEHEEDLDTDQPKITLINRLGRINSDLTVGIDITTSMQLRANTDLASMGPALGGRGFVISQAHPLVQASSRKWLRRLTTGNDITGRHRNRFVINVSEFETSDEVRRELPDIYQHLKETVYPRRSTNNDPKLRTFWWRYRRSNEIYFSAVNGLPRFIATVETTKHRVFVFVGSDEMLEHGVVGIALDDAYCLGVLSSSIHIGWTLASGGTLEDRPRYNKIICFDPFPFPDCSDALKIRIRATAEELDAHRKARQAAHPTLTLTQMYNVLEAMRAGDELDADAEKIKQYGLILILRELHDTLDALVLEAYGWTDQPSGEQILERLVALNAQRAAEEAAGTIRWLRPEYQIPKFGSDAERARLEEERRRAKAEAGLRPRQGSLDLDDDLREMMPGGDVSKPKYPTGDELAETAAIMRTLMSANAPMSIAELASTFAQGRQIERRVAVTVQALARLSHVLTVDAGRTFALLRVG